MKDSVLNFMSVIYTKLCATFDKKFTVRNKREKKLVKLAAGILQMQQTRACLHSLKCC